jgi:hypothetical protein
MLPEVLRIINDIITQSAAKHDAQQDEDEEIFDMMIQYILYPGKLFSKISFLRQKSEADITQNERDEIENPVSVDMK